DAAKGTKREHDLADRLLDFAANVEYQAALLDAQVQTVRPAVGARRREAVFLDQVENGDRPLMLDLQTATNDRALVERHLGDAAAVAPSRVGQAQAPVAAGAVAPVQST